MADVSAHKPSSVPEELDTYMHSVYNPQIHNDSICPHRGSAKSSEIHWHGYIEEKSSTEGSACHKCVRLLLQAYFGSNTKLVFCQRLTSTFISTDQRVRMIATLEAIISVVCLPSTVYIYCNKIKAIRAQASPSPACKVHKRLTYQLANNLAVR